MCVLIYECVFYYVQVLGVGLPQFSLVSDVNAAGTAGFAVLTLAHCIVCAYLVCVFLNM
jgi:hypothetical protein